ncbi:hypothetical protein EVA_02488 [gut metagenome]|uniref:Uncharacterized protein n=1 Tax=gut metagenome TaxID=749906 RepID=J9H5V3_9ZZZZ
MQENSVLLQIYPVQVWTVGNKPLHLHRYPNFYNLFILG